MAAIAKADLNTLTASGFASRPIYASRSLALTGLMAGLAGGLAEAVWIGLYSGATGANGTDIVRRIADAVFPGVLHISAAPALGFTIHFGLSAVMGVLLARPLTRAAQREPNALLPICLGILALIWGMNFLLILPILNPIFPTLLPAWVTLGSKLLFGVALAGVIGRRSTKVA